MRDNMDSHFDIDLYVVEICKKWRAIDAEIIKSDELNKTRPKLNRLFKSSVRKSAERDLKELNKSVKQMHKTYVGVNSSKVWTNDQLNAIRTFRQLESLFPVYDKGRGRRFWWFEIEKLFVTAERRIKNRK